VHLLPDHIFETRAAGHERPTDDGQTGQTLKPPLRTSHIEQSLRIYFVEKLDERSRIFGVIFSFEAVRREGFRLQVGADGCFAALDRRLPLR
jgi:hypothetical protein